jgi:hypothetical protein
VRYAIAIAATICALLGIASSASAAVSWEVVSSSNTTVANADDPSTENVTENQLTYFVDVINTGDQGIFGEEYVMTTRLPAGLVGVEGHATGLDPQFNCENVAGETTFTCNAFNAPVDSRSLVAITVEVLPGTEGTETAEFEVSGGGAPEPASTVDPVRISSAPVPFGIDAFDMKLGDSAGAPFRQAAGHPYDFTTYLDFNKHTDTSPTFNPFTGNIIGPDQPVEPPRDVVAELPPGLLANPGAAAKCRLSELANGEGVTPAPLCSVDSQVGSATVLQNGMGLGSVLGPVPVFDMVPPPGAAARFGFNVAGTIVVLDATLRSDSDYGVAVSGRNLSEGLAVSGSDLTIWGVPADPSHDSLRACPGQPNPGTAGPSCTASASPRGFLRMPTRCAPSLGMGVSVDSWIHPGAFGSNGRPDLSDPAWATASAANHEAPGYPYPVSEQAPPAAVEGCAKVPVKAKLSAQPTALEAETSSGLSVHVEVPNPGLEAPEGLSTSDVKDVRVALPQGVTINPSQAEGLGVCSPAQYESSRLEFHPDGQHGCPSDSKVGTVSVKTPLLEETLPGNVYVAKPYDNPFNSLLALYIVVEEPQRGILVKLPGELRLNETTGRIEAEFDELPQTPFESFDFKFREGARAPLATPPSCGTYETEAVFTPWSDPAKKLQSNSSFQITRGIGGGPCPPNGTPGFKPLFSAGSINNNAGAHTAFDMRIQRNDGEQDMTRFSAVLPPGVLGKLAGVAKCPISAIAIAKSKSGIQEQQSPSCPANSQIGNSLVGAGVGSVLTYVPGKVYLGAPFHGDPLSVIAITPVVAGPFDVGTVVVHEALTLNPKTAEVEVDGSASDPIPHILKGIPAKLRDLRVYVDRPDFIINPTSCDPSSTRATLFGGGGNAFSTLDDVPVSLSDRFQAASCASLGFKPNLQLNLKGGTKRGGHPALVANYKPRSGDANAKGLVVRLPRSAFLDQAHIRTICTRVQFAAKSCPPAAQYGYIKAWTPLLETPLEGPVWLRSSNHKLPDLVFDLHGLVDIEVATRIDSIHGGVRATVNDIPDAPLSKVVLNMQGAKKGLIVNSRNLCGGTNRANAQFEGQNGKEASLNPVMRAECGGKRRKKR